MKPFASRDEGMTLVELIIVSALTLLVLAFVSAFVINAINTQNTVTGTTENATGGGLVAQTIVSNVQKASVVKVTGGTRLDMRTQDNSGSWVCLAIAFDSGSIRETSSSATISTPVSSWAALVDSGASAITTTPVFSLSASSSSSASASASATSGATGTIVNYSFEIVNGGAPVTFVGSATMRVGGSAASASAGAGTTQCGL